MSSSCTFSLFKLMKMTSTQVSVKRFSYRQDTLVDVISVNFNSKKVYEDEIFSRQDKLQFFPRESKDYKCLRKMFGVRGTLNILFYNILKV